MLLPLLAVLWMLSGVTAQTTSATPSMNYRWFCDLTLNPVVTLEWDSSTNGYVVQKPRHGEYYGYNGQIGSSGQGDEDGGTTTTGTQDPWTRRLMKSLLQSVIGSSEEDDDDDGTTTTPLAVGIPLAAPNLRSPALLPQWDHNMPALAVNNNNNNTSDSRKLRLIQDRQQSPVVVENNMYPFDDFNTLSPNSALTVQARSCDCWNSMVWGGAFYCPTPRTHCAIPSSPIGVPGCVDIQKQRRIVRSIWPVLVVWYASVLFCLSFTITGRHAMSCCIATVYPAWNRRTAERLLQDDPNQANQMLLRHYRIMRARYERRLMRRLRRRAQRDRRRARRRRRQQDENGGDNNNSDDSSESELEEELPFPNLWDLAIIPRPISTSAQDPQPATLVLKTRIYKQKSKDDEEENDNHRAPPPSSQPKVEQFVDEAIDESSAEEVASGKTEEEEEDSDLQGEESDGNNDEKETPEMANDDAAHDSTSTNLGTDAQGDTSDGTTKKAEEQVEDEIVVQPEPEKSSSDEGPEEASNNQGSSDDVFVEEEEPADPVEENNTASAPVVCAPCADHDVSEWDDDNTCTICYASLEDGDRVGALPCGHEFHVDPCLKHWLTRRNVCPLCLTENIATPRYADGSPAPLAATNTDDSNTNDGMGENMPPIILSFNPPDSSSSDQDRSSSQDDDDSSGILDDPNRIPAFGGPRTDQPVRHRTRAMAGFTSLFRRRRTENDDANNSSPPNGSEQAP
ncbi:Probable E3 ubiquitin-protein ligase [Seminavis robusta]|uniref:RING-type E3 ubiquitin transferase n=1 Tax=Seminavis robusta TaxID=568900 RepID=A0A9N8EFH7_9STRA|nr:Probable E3 ubiquitin-protein ligase [Seminavis robusta]|eukprot:Sro1003_g230010.1 Probable E3 ubiquitin-protein ligase (738) ;mRNA; r:13836-16049